MSARESSKRSVGFQALLCEIVLWGVATVRVSRGLVDLSRKWLLRGGNTTETIPLGPLASLGSVTIHPAPQRQSKQ